LVYNYIGPLYGVPAKKGESVTMIISTYADGTHTATVYENNHLPGILILCALFVAACILVGGKNGAKSLIGLVFIIVNLFFVLLPALMKGAPTVLTTFIVSIIVSAFGLTIMSGVNKKTVCAFLGTVSGVAMAFLFAWLAQKILKIDGLRTEDVEGLLQLRQTGTPIKLRGLLSAGIIISSIGAVMDVAMGLASAAGEIHEANPQMSVKRLFASGMNIGKDMVGTMTGTLILAFLGSSFVLILYLYSLGLGKYQFLSSAYFSVEIINGLSSSIGAILSIPITAIVSAIAFGKGNK
ncbi:MAG: YibE/F family protein, partial [Erysipelotrichaceae bacterium]|nr:YibE/F family protein [Erysipelotrichaceae bacterium]